MALVLRSPDRPLRPRPLMASVGAEVESTHRGGPHALLHQEVAFVVMVVVLAVLPFFVYPIFLMKALCFALFACAFNLLIGYVGLLSFGHAAFLGSAGYVTAHAAKVWGWPPELAIAAGTATAAALGLAVGALAIRSRGIYFANITLALAQMIYFFFLQAKFTGGEDGIQSVPRGVMFGFLDLRPTVTLYFVVLAIFLAGFLLVYRTIHSPFGQVSRRSGRTRRAPSRSATARSTTSSSPSSRPRHASGLAADQGHRLPSSEPRTDVHWTIPGRWAETSWAGSAPSSGGVGAFLLITIEHYLAQWRRVTSVQGVISCSVCWPSDAGWWASWPAIKKPLGAAPAVG